MEIRKAFLAKYLRLREWWFHEFPVMTRKRHEAALKKMQIEYDGAMRIKDSQIHNTEAMMQEIVTELKPALDQIMPIVKRGGGGERIYHFDVAIDEFVLHGVLDPGRSERMIEFFSQYIAHRVTKELTMINSYRYRFTTRPDTGRR